MMNEFERQDPSPGIADVAKRAVLGLIALVATLALLGAAGNLVLFDSAIGRADADIVGWIADNRVGVLDSLASTASALSDTWTVIGVMVGAGSMLWAAGHRRHAATIGLAVALEFATFLAVGALIGRVRPDVEALGSVPSTPSFPSGHTAAAFVLYGALVLVARSLEPARVPRALWVVPTVIAVIVAAARVYEGVHHPIDVAAGLLLGVAAVLIAGRATEITSTSTTDGDQSSEPVATRVTQTATTSSSRG